MSYHPRIENPDLATLSTIRSRNAELWFVNNRKLEKAILSYLAVCANRYSSKIYAFGLEGNHTHTLGLYQENTQSAFHRDLNSRIAKAIPKYIPNYPGGRFWARRYSSEYVPGFEDIEEYFFYIVLQPVKDGLVDKISEYPGYNCFHDAITEKERAFEVINWQKFHDRKRFDPFLSPKDCAEEVILKYQRLPGYESLTQAEYRSMMIRKFEERRVKLIEERGIKQAMGTAKLRLVRPGSQPAKPKTSSRESHRPRVLSICSERRAYWKAWYFASYFDFKIASKQFREGALLVEFPKGTCRPPNICKLAIGE